MDQLSLLSEEKLLLYCSRLSISDDFKHKIDKIFSEELDWNFILERSARQGISPLFYWNLKNINHSKDVPPEIVKNLEKRYYNNLARNMLLYEELGKVLKAFKRVGIGTIVLKGAFLAEEIYKNIGLRTMSDIDLLIKKEDLQKVMVELTKLKYFATIIFPTKLHEQFQTVWNKELPFINQDKEIVIEIHWDIQSPQSIYQVNIDEFWSNAKSVNINGTDVLVFSPENMLQHLCLHVDKHIYYSKIPAKPLRDYCDIAEVIRHYNDKIDWNYFLQGSKDYGIEEPIFHGMSIVKKYFGAFVPENILNELELVNSRIRFEEILTGSIEINSGKKDQMDEINCLINLKKIDGFWNKSRIIFGIVFPSKEYIMYRYKTENKKQVYLLYLVHASTVGHLGSAILSQLPRKIIGCHYRK